MTITINSGRIVATAEDDGINAAGGDSGDQPRPGPRPWPWNKTRNNLRNGRLGEPGPGPSPGGRGNASYYISIYGGEVWINHSLLYIGARWLHNQKYPLFDRKLLFHFF